MPVIWIAVGAAALYLLQRWLYERYWNMGLTAGLAFQTKSAVEGEEGLLLERVENRKALPLPMVKVKFQVSRNLRFADEGEGSVTDQYYRNDILSLSGHQRVIRRLPFSCMKRGYYCIHGLDLVGADLFLSQEMMMETEGESVLYVYPRPAEGVELMAAIRKLNGEILAKRHMLEDPFEYRGIREYAPFDEMKSINWKATARTDELMVNIRGYTALQSVRIFLNLEDAGIRRKSELIELCIRIAVRFAQELLDQGIRVAVFANGRDVLSGEILRMLPGAGVSHMESINRAFARLDVEKTTDFEETFARELEQEEKETAALFLSLERGSRFVHLMEKFARHGTEFAWFCPLLPDMESGVENPERLHFVRLDAEEMLNES